MSRIYIVLALVLISVAGGLLLLPDSKKTSELTPELLYKEVNDPARYVSVDYVAERLVNEDPSVMLIDVRTPAQANEFSLPGALNIPLNEIMLPEFQEYLNQEDMDVIFYSNGDLYADQAWILCTRMGFKNLYVMSGGINQWFADIMQPVLPSETSPSEDFERYTFRQAASMYFSGSENISNENLGTEPVILVKRNKKTASGGGC